MGLRAELLISNPFQFYGYKREEGNKKPSLGEARLDLEKQIARGIMGWSLHRSNSDMSTLPIYLFVLQLSN